MQKSKGEETSEHIIATLKVEKEELESSLNKEKLQSLQLKQELAEAEARNTELYKVISCLGTVVCIRLDLFLTKFFLYLRSSNLYVVNLLPSSQDVSN